MSVLVGLLIGLLIVVGLVVTCIRDEKAELTKRDEHEDNSI